MSETTLSLDPFTPDHRIAFVQVYEANAAAYALALAAAGGGLVQRERDFNLAIFPYPHPINGVFLPRFDPEDGEERLEMILSIARASRTVAWAMASGGEFPSSFMAAFPG